MEDDNAVDILKWLFKESTEVDYRGDLKIVRENSTVDCAARLKGNLLGLKPIIDPTEPILIVCEKTQVEKVENDESTFVVKYGPHCLTLRTTSNKEVEAWMIKLATASYLFLSAELDQVAHDFYNQTNIDEGSPSSSKSNLSHYFLDAPFKKDFCFSLFQSYNVPNRKFYCDEEMYESKLSMSIPLELLKLYKQWSSELRNELRDKFWAVRNASIVEATHTAVRHLNSNIEIYNQSIEFLEGYSGPYFRPSVEKFRMAFGAVPLNLHVQFFQIDGKPTGYLLTSGATAAVPLRFTNGGLSRQKTTLHIAMDPIKLDHTNESRFYARRQILQTAKRRIGDLTRKIENDWHVSSFGVVDKIGLGILAEVTQLQETVCDLISSFPEIDQLVDSLYNHSLTSQSSSVVHDTLSNQLDRLDACKISLNSKMAAIDSVEDNQKGREPLEMSAKAALHSILDALLHLIDGLLLAQLYGLMLALQKPLDCQTYFHIQLRFDMVLSQAITIVSTALLAALERSSQEAITTWDSYSPLVTIFSFLSCHADEKGMLEDMSELWPSFYNRVKFKFVPTASSISRTCVPQISGHRNSISVILPLLPATINLLPPKLKEGAYFFVRTIFWNLGINHEATFAASLGDISVEEGINRAALAHMDSYATSYPHFNTTISEMMSDLRNVVNENPSRKNIAIFPRVMALTNALNGTSVIGCKSGKDRTSMAVTLEEGRIVKENCGISSHQVIEVVDTLRRNGCRRENCRKNVGKALYSFSPFQLHFLPKEFRPPAGAFAHNVAS
uniref:Uncharacterized protein n=1 Tax=Acrobeloides nanus TaxID=290746 RepID=A0A914CBN2_9BILA